MSVNYGSKRIVVGAHYGLRDWLASASPPPSWPSSPSSCWRSLF